MSTILVANATPYHMWLNVPVTMTAEEIIHAVSHIVREDEIPSIPEHLYGGFHEDAGDSSAREGIVCHKVMYTTKARAAIEKKNRAELWDSLFLANPEDLKDFNPALPFASDAPEVTEWQKTHVGAVEKAQEMYSLVAVLRQFMSRD